MVVYSLYIIHWPETHLDYLRSELLLHRSYNNSLPDQTLVLQNFENAYKNLLPEERTPFIHSRGINYVYMRGDNDIILIAVTKKNINAMLTVVFLHNFYGILFHYICDMARKQKTSQEDLRIGAKLSKEVIMDSSTLIFELLDECMDFGIVQVTDYKILREYIKVEANLPKLGHYGEQRDEYSSESDIEVGDKSDHKRKQAKDKIKKVKSTHNQAVNADIIDTDASYINTSVLRATSLAISWRPKGIFYPKNEIYIDIIENCEFLFSLSTNSIKRNEVYGRCLVKCYLSGMPVCKLGFNEKYISGIDNEDEYMTYEDSKNEDTVRSDNLLKLEDSNLTVDGDDENLSEDGIEETLDGIKSTVELGEEDTKTTDDIVSENIPNENHRKRKKKNHKIPIRNIQFHQCIELASVYKENIINFIPPDDKFVLMTYHVEQQKQKRKLPLIMVKPTYRILKLSNKLQIMCILSTNFKKRLHCRNLIIKIPINPHLIRLDHEANEFSDGMKFKAEIGNVSYKIDSSELFWYVDNVNGKIGAMKMMAEMALASKDNDNLTLEAVQDSLNNKYMQQSDAIEDLDDDTEAKEDLDRYYGVNGAVSSLAKRIQKLIKFSQNFNQVKCSFNIPMLSYSGLKLTYLKVAEEQMKYTCFPWVRYITESNSDTYSSNKVEDESLSTRDCNYNFELGLNCFQFVD